MNWFKSLSGQISIAIVTGIVVGLSLGTDANMLGELGKILITLIKAIAGPLIFFAIIDSIITSEMRGRDFIKLFRVVAINGLFAAFIGLTLSNLVEPGKHLDLGQKTNVSAEDMKKFDIAKNKIDLTKTVTGFFPTNVVDPFQQNTVISIVFLALLTGFSFRRVKQRQIKQDSQAYKTLENIFSGCYQMLEVVLSWVILIIPLSIFGVVAKTVGEYGFSPLKGLAFYLGVAIAGFLIQVLVIYQAWIKLYAGIPLRKFWSAVKEPVMYGLGCNSSLATLPVTLKALDNLGISRRASRLGACVGTNLNNDGILLYEAMAVIFVAQAYGIEMDFSQQMMALLFAVVGAVGITGIPEAGIISLSLVLTTVGLPLEILPILLTVDWIIARGRTVVNVLSDIVTSIVVDQQPKADEHLRQVSA
jgi:Na+/H+-dicarboxylate symporter